MMLTIGLIDNFAIVRLGLAMILQEGLKQVEILEASNIREYQALPKRTAPDLLILGNNSDTATECINQVVEIRNAYPKTPLIVYDDQKDESLIVPYFSRDVKGYITKSNIAQEMIRCVAAVSEGKTFLCPVLLEILLNEITHNKDHVHVLTRRETEIARYLTDGMRTSWIAKKLGRKPSTVSTIKNNIYRKMSVDNTMELRNKLRQNGALL